MSIRPQLWTSLHAALGALLLAALTVQAGHSVPDLRAVRPFGTAQTYLWAWERPEDLQFINPREVGVAFLAATVYLAGDSVTVRPRLQPLRIPAATDLIAVVRVESRRTEPPALTAGQLSATAEAITRISTIPGVGGIQVDFDAAVSERDFYRRLLIELRRQLQPAMPLSVTALASWCIGDPWLDALPAGTIDEAVPMLFRIGVDRSNVLVHLARGDGFRNNLCTAGVGLSTDEPLPSLPPPRRIYLFHPRPWTRSAFEKAIREVRKQP